MIDKDKTIYLAVPYRPTKEHVERFLVENTTNCRDLEQARKTANLVIMDGKAKLADRSAAWLMQQGYIVLSPISHSHGMAQHMPPEKRVDHDFWMRQDAPFVRAADVMLILTLDGWRESRGIRHEIREFAARRRGLNRYLSEFDCKACRNVFFLNKTADGYEISRRPV